MRRDYFFIAVGLLCGLMLLSACNKPANKNVSEPQPMTKTDVDSETEMIQNTIKNRAEQATKALEHQKDVKEQIAQLPVIETFTRETSEREVLSKLGEPQSTRELKMEKIDQRVLFYNDKKFAVWFWRENEDQGPYQYRATMSLNHGKFDIPLHNVLTEDELKHVLDLLDEKH